MVKLTKAARNLKADERLCKRCSGSGIRVEKTSVCYRCRGLGVEKISITPHDQQEASK